MTCPTTSRCCAGPGRAIAVGNAHHEVLAVADEVTGSNDEDGVAQVLEEIFGLAPEPDSLDA